MTETAPRDPWLLTPGPLTTAESTRLAMLHDWGSRDSAFIAMTERVRRRLAEIAGGGDLVSVPLQGSGTFVVEAALEDMGVQERAPAPARLAAGTRVVAGSPR
jgi:2-aminoethylphosphonate-pyruvate transaminase